MSEALQLFVPEGRWCSGCILRHYCGSEGTAEVCAPNFDPHGVAGPELLHPARPDFEIEFDRVGGVGFSDIVARPQALPVLGTYLPQVRWLASLRHQALAPPQVGVRLDAVTSHGRVRTAAELRDHTGLPATTQIVLLLFAKDAALEAFAERGHDALNEIAAGGYAASTTPSYSVWGPRRRPNNVLSLKRSMLTLAALQERGVPTIPRIAWVEPKDAFRFAEWCNANPTITTVSIDLMGYGPRSFDSHTGLLAKFDALTGARLHYLVNGLNSFERIFDTYVAVPPERVTATDATLPRMPRRGANGKLQRGFRARVAASEELCARARRQLEALEQGSVEEVGVRASLIAERRAEISRLVRRPVGRLRL